MRHGILLPLYSTFRRAALGHRGKPHSFGIAVLSCGCMRVRACVWVCFEHVSENLLILPRNPLEMELPMSLQRFIANEDIDERHWMELHRHCELVKFSFRISEISNVYSF